MRATKTLNSNENYNAENIQAVKKAVEQEKHLSTHKKVYTMIQTNTPSTVKISETSRKKGIAKLFRSMSV